MNKAIDEIKDTFAKKHGHHNWEWANKEDKNFCIKHIDEVIELCLASQFQQPPTASEGKTAEQILNEKLNGSDYQFPDIKGTIIKAMEEYANQKLSSQPPLSSGELPSDEEITQRMNEYFIVGGENKDNSASYRHSFHWAKLMRDIASKKLAEKDKEAVELINWLIKNEWIIWHPQKGMLPFHIENKISELYKNFQADKLKQKKG